MTLASLSVALNHHPIYLLISAQILSRQYPASPDCTSKNTHHYTAARREAGRQKQGERRRKGEKEKKAKHLLFTFIYQCFGFLVLFRSRTLFWWTEGIWTRLSLFLVNSDWGSNPFRFWVFGSKPEVWQSPALSLWSSPLSLKLLQMCGESGHEARPSWDGLTNWTQDVKSASSFCFSWWVLSTSFQSQAFPAHKPISDCQASMVWKDAWQHLHAMGLCVCSG